MYRRIIATLLAFIMILGLGTTAFAMPLVAAETSTPITSEQFENFGFTLHTSNNTTVPLRDGMTLVADNRIHDSWYIHVTDDLMGEIEIAYRIGSRFFTRTITIDGSGRYIIGDSRGSNGLTGVRVGEFVEGDGPRIIVHTQFPVGRTVTSFVDIQYTATPTEGADIDKIYYSINGVFHRYIYLAGIDGVTPMGTLGEARVFIVPGENQLVFTLVDTFGSSANFVVASVPVFDEGMTPHTPPMERWQPSRDGGGWFFADNRLMLRAVLGWGQMDEEEFHDAITSRGGVVVGTTFTGLFTIEVEPTTEENLEVLGQSFLDEFPHLFVNFHLNVDDFSTTTQEWRTETYITPQQDDIDGEGGGNTFRPDDPWWSNGREWGLTAINMPHTWSHFGSEEIQNIRVGIIDTGVRHYHQDLMIPEANIGVHPGAEGTDRNHGTHVMGTIGAIHGNNLGLSGIANIPRENLFSYNSFNTTNSQGGIATDTLAQLSGLRWNVVRGVQIINASIGGVSNPNTNTTNQFHDEMQTLLNLGYDFIVVHSAGNSRIDARYNGSFAHVTEPHLRERIITVGASQLSVNLSQDSIDHRNECEQDVVVADFWRNPNNQYRLGGSNFGHRVDLFAPGHTIWSAGSLNNFQYMNLSGTSMAAPHVSGIAAMVWSFNPGLSGVQVRDIIVESANWSHRTILDTRFPDEIASSLNHQSGNNIPQIYYGHLNPFGALGLARNTYGEHTHARILGNVYDASTTTGSVGTWSPVNNAHVRVNVAPFGSVVAYTQTNNGGFYRLDNIPANINYVMNITATGFINERINMGVLPGGVTVQNAHIRLVTSVGTTTGIAGGTIQTITGDEWSPYTISPFNYQSAINTPITLELRRGVNNTEGEPDAVVVSDDGRFYIHGIEPGNYTVIALGEGFIPTQNQIILHWDKDSDTDEYWLNQVIYIEELTQLTRILAGRITHQTSHYAGQSGTFSGTFGVGGVRVMVYDETGTEFVTETTTFSYLDDGNHLISDVGRFSVMLYPGIYTLVFQMEGFENVVEWSVVVSSDEAVTHQEFMLPHDLPTIYQVSVNGSLVNHEQYFVRNHRTQYIYALSLRVIGQAYGFTVDWDYDARMAILESDSWELRRIFPADSNTLVFERRYGDGWQYYQTFELPLGAMPFIYYNSVMYLRYDLLWLATNLSASVGLIQGSHSGVFSFVFASYNFLFPFMEN